MHELTGIAFSHYVEKARWALHRFGVPYSEHKVLPIFHFVAVYRVHRGKLGRTDSASTRFSTPVLRTDTGRILCDSADIVRYVSDRYAPPGERLYDHPEATKLEQHFHDKLGPATRLFAYDFLFKHPQLLRALVNNNVGRLQRIGFAIGAPLVPFAISRVIGPVQKLAPQALTQVEHELESVSERLKDGRPFLLGDRFSAADLAFACMAAPFLLPPQYSAWFPPFSQLPEQLQKLASQWRATAAGSLAMRLFEQERWRVVNGASTRSANGALTAASLQ